MTEEIPDPTKGRSGEGLLAPMTRRLAAPSAEGPLPIRWPRPPCGLADPGRSSGRACSGRRPMTSVPTGLLLHAETHRAIRCLDATSRRGSTPRRLRSITAQCLADAPDRVGVGRRQGEGFPLLGPPAGRLGVDPDVFVALLERRAEGRLEARGGEVILLRVPRIPALLPPVVIEPEAESGGDDASVSRPVGGQRRRRRSRSPGGRR